jgi:O-succinylbenzoic acid--CoA ligase
MSYCLCPLKQAASLAPSLPALISKDLTLTFKQLDDLADQFCYLLQMKQIQENDLIAVLHKPCHELIALFFAAWRIGASICPLNTKLPQVDSLLCQIQPKLFISSFPFHDAEMTEADPLPFSQSLLLFTSGSTGRPKIAVLSLESLIINGQHSIPLESSDRYLLSIPLYHVGGIGIMLRSVLAKASIVLDKANQEITHISCVPTQLYRESPIYQNLKSILLGGAPIQKISPFLPIACTYGLTEMGSMVLVQTNPKIIESQIYLGHPLPKRKIQLAEDGEIQVSGETLFKGYLENRELLSPFDEGWFNTGDIGTQDPIHGIAIIGRKDWQFICGGENIQPEEIEQYLLRIPDVLEAVVLPQKDPEFGMKPIAILATNHPSMSKQMIQEILSEFLPRYKIPTEIYFTHSIPKNGLKIDRKKTLDLFSQKNHLIQS